MPTMPFIKCGRLYRTNATLRYQVISKRGPKRGRQSPMKNLRQEFFHIQGEIATIIFREVQVKGSIFHSNIAPSNGEIEARLKALRDTRPFMTKEGCRPFPEPSQK